MQIPNVDYGPLYRAASFKTAGKKSLLLDDSASLTGRQLELQSKGLDLRQKEIDQQSALLPWQIATAALNTADTILDAGIKIYGLVEQQKALEAKNAMMGEQVKIHQLADEMVRANKFLADGEKITLNEELKYYVENRSMEIQRDFKGFKSVQLMIDTQLKGIAEAETLYAYNQIAQKTQKETLMLAEEGLTNSYQAAVSSGSYQPLNDYINALVSDGIVSQKGAELLKEQYKDKWEAGTRENILRQTVQTEGREAAITVLQNDDRFLGMSEQEIVGYLNVIDNAENVTKILDGKKISEVVDIAKNQGKDIDGQIEAVRKLYWDGEISKSSFEGVKDKLQLGQEEATLKSIVATQGDAAGYKWSAAQYANDPVKRQAMDGNISTYAKQAENEYIDRVSKSWTERVETGGENPRQFEQWVKSNVPTAYQDAILGTVKAKRAVREHSETLSRMNQPGVRSDSEELNKLYNEVLNDPNIIGRYAGIEEQRQADLNMLQQGISAAGGELSKTELSNHYANELNKIVQTLREGKITPAEAWAQGNGILNAGSTLLSPGVSAGFYSAMNELAPSRFMQASKRINDLMKDVTSQYGKFRKWIDANPVDGNSALKSLGEAIQNMLNENPNMSDTDINQRTDKAVEAFISTVIDLNNKAQSSGGYFSAKDFYNLQKEVDRGGLDLPMYTDTNERVVYPIGAETAMKKYSEFKIDQIKAIAGKDVTESYAKEGLYDIGAQNYYTTKDGKEKYYFRAGKDGLEMVKQGGQQATAVGTVTIPDKVIATESGGKMVPVKTEAEKVAEKRAKEIEPQVKEMESKIFDLERQINIYSKQAGTKNKTKTKELEEEKNKLMKQLEALQTGG